jgi:hypothetical protein
MADREDNETLSQEVDELLNQGLSPKEIEERGYSPSLIRQRMRKRAKSGNAPAPKNEGALVRRQSEAVLPEWLQAEVAELFDGSAEQKRTFLAGMAVPLMGLRLFAEGVKPLVDLMATWQKGQAEAMLATQGARADVAQQAAHQALNAAMPHLLEAVRAQGTANSPNPMQTMFVDALRPYLGQVMGQVMSGLMAPLAGGQAPPGGWQPPPGQVPQPGIPQATREEIEEAFDD